MHVQNPWNPYRKVATQTAPPGQLILMLFEGAIRHLERALPGFAIDDPAEANMAIHNNLQRAQEIIRDLNQSLNLEQGGEFATTMRRLYDYFERKLWESNFQKNRNGVDEVIKHLSVLRDAWAVMLHKQNPNPDTPPPVVAELAVA